MSDAAGGASRPAGESGIDESQQGYPEEAPEGTDPGHEPPAEEKPQRRGGRQEHDPGEPGEDGKATGNPHSAG